jgi:hypothetical protein
MLSTQNIHPKKRQLMATILIFVANSFSGCAPNIPIQPSIAPKASIAEAKPAEPSKSLVDKPTEPPVPCDQRVVPLSYNIMPIEEFIAEGEGSYQLVSYESYHSFHDWSDRSELFGSSEFVIHATVSQQLAEIPNQVSASVTCSRELGDFTSGGVHTQTRIPVKFLRSNGHISGTYNFETTHYGPKAGKIDDTQGTLDSSRLNFILDVIYELKKDFDEVIIYRLPGNRVQIYLKDYKYGESYRSGTEKIISAVFVLRI